VAHGQLFFQEDVEALAKDVNQMAELNRPRPARQQGYNYPKPTNSLQIPTRVVEKQRPKEEHHEEHHHDHDHHHDHSHIHLTRLDVTCDARGMSVELEFSGAFNGLVYSKGHFRNRNCR
jgi:G3E family GTPase